MKGRWKASEENHQKKYLFFDLLNTGHHYQYNLAVMKGVLKGAPSSEVTYYSSRLEENRRAELEAAGISYQRAVERRYHRYMPSMLVRALLLLQVLRFAYKHKSVLHLLYLDTLIIPLVFLIPALRGMKITATLHWYPPRESKRRLLRNLLRRQHLDKLIVHGDYLRKQVLELTSVEQSRVSSIVYPNLHPAVVQETVQAPDIHASQGAAEFVPTLLCFGGLRYDKGIDLLLEAAGRLTGQPFSILVAGREQDFTRGDLEQIIRDKGLEHKVELCLEYIPDHEVPLYFERADIIVLPYRKMFSGQSGPLTEAAARGKVIIGPSHGEIGYCIERYGLGVSFRAEDISDLGDKIVYAIHNMDELRRKSQSSEYKALLSPGIFEQRYFEELAG
ncbi:glycosyltransferase family 4 protein [Paenibacillus sp. IHBB 3054]|uniref:glycosyltransferase family 4 protein n=1 Tax=Paenibacillus sp. IHBB 3054 TaxID=3425689 RepID=UPI003F6750C3